MANLHTFVTECNECGRDATSTLLDLTNSNKTRIENLEGMEFMCECGASTYVEIETYSE